PPSDWSAPLPWSLSAHPGTCNQRFCSGAHGHAGARAGTIARFHGSAGMRASGMGRRPSTSPFSPAGPPMPKLESGIWQGIMAKILVWLSENSAMVQAFTGIITALVWIFYLQILVSGFRRQRRSIILIHGAGNDNLDPRIFVTNLGFEN